MNTIIIRFIDSNNGENLKDYEIPFNSKLKFSNLKTIIRENVSYCSNKRLKLIFNGRVINDKFDINDLKFSEQKCYIHCVIGEVLTIDELNKENQLDNKEIKRTTEHEVIGFDRLLQQGFSQQDINDLRFQFENIYNIDRSHQSQINDLEEEERRNNYLRQLEERWIELTVNPTPSSGTGGDSTQNNPDGNTTTNEPTNDDTVQHNLPATDLDDNHNTDLLIGLLIGVFLGILGGLFMVIDDSVFNKRQKMAIVAGIFINFSIAIVRGQWI